MKKILLQTFLFLGLSTVLAQDYEYGEVSSLTPPSPEAFNFSTYGNIPLNGTTGGFSYSVPLFSLKEGDISLGISMDYYSNGVNIDALHSVTGTDWTLNAGGVISRVVRDKPDVDVPGWYPTTIDEYGTDYNRFYTLAYSEENQFAEDTQHDWFSFSVNGLSGKFYLDPGTGSVIVDSKEYVKIEYQTLGIDTNGLVFEFTVTDQRGYIYTFGGSAAFSESNFSTSTCDNYNKDSYYSAWYLKSIVSPKNNMLTLEYIANPRYYATGVSDTATYDQDCGGLSSFSFDYSSCVGYNNNNSKLVSKITGTNFEADFVYVQNTDLNGLVLDRALLYADGQPMPHYGFIYDVETAGTGSDTNNNLSSNETITKRLFLKGILNYNSDETSHTSYTFDYYNKDLLPHRLSAKKDRFGYYNGSNNAASSPFETQTESSVYFLTQTLNSSLFTANRDVNPNTVHFGMLKRITYPTGGHSEIVYEANSDLGYTNSDALESQTFEVDKDCNDPDEVRTFQFVSNGSKIDYRLSGGLLNLNGCINDEVTDHDKMILTISGGGTSRIVNVQVDEYINTETSAYNYCGGRMDQCFATVAGEQYTITFRVTSKDNSVFGDLRLKYNRSTQQVETTVYAGGARVKSLVDFDGNGAVVQQKDHYYDRLENYPFNTPETSLIKTYDPQYVHEFTYTKRCDTQVSPATRYTVSSNSYNPLYDTRNGVVYYAAISELSTDGTSPNGAVEKVFFNVGDSPPEHLTEVAIPGLPYSNSSHINFGLLDKINYYKNDPTGPTIPFEMVKTEDLNYTNMSYGIIPEYAIKKNYDHPAQVVILDDLENISISRYYNFYGFRNLESKTTRTYLEGNVLEVNESYQYSTGPYYALLSSKHVDSDMETTVKEYQYPQLKSSPTTVEQGLIDKNMLVPVQTSIVGYDANDVEVSRMDQMVNYKDWGNNLFLVENVQSAKSILSGTPTTENRLEFHEYDDLGNSVELSRTEGPHTYYVWGYQGQYPIAKLENFKTGQITSGIQTLMDAAVLASDNDDDRTRDILNGGSVSYLGNEGALREALENLRVALPAGTLMTGFTYDPLTGVTSTMDSRGYCLYYGYDTFNRLKSIIDEEGNLVKDHKYHFQTEQSQ